MSFIALTPVQFNMTARQGTVSEATTPVIKDGSGTAIDFSAWNVVQASVLPSANFPGAFSLNIGTATGNADGTIKVHLSATQFAGPQQNGAGTLLITGKVASGDSFQLLASGTLNVLPGLS